MCGRFTLIEKPEILARRFDISNMGDIAISPRYNIAPSQDVLIVVNDGVRNKAGFVKWGLLPFWSKEEKTKYNLINARSETMEQKPSFRHLLGKRRCIVIADSYYEWQQTNAGKLPHRILMKTEEPFAFAGLWDRWVQEEKEIVSCTIITKSANEEMKDLHDRVPIILSKENEKNWLDTTITAFSELKACIENSIEADLKWHTVSSIVNSPKNEVEQCILPL